MASSKPSDASNVLQNDRKTAIEKKREWQSFQNDMNREMEDAKSTEQSVASQEIGVGQKTEVKDLYPSRNSICTCCIEWLDEAPFNREVQKSANNTRERNTFAIIRKREAHGGQGWKIRSIAINSPYIKAGLKSVFEYYPAVDVESPELEFDVPFIPFLHRWERLEALKTERDDTGKELGEKGQNLTNEHLELLLQILEPELKSIFDKVSQFEDTKYVHFEDLPLVFIPGETIVQEMYGTMRAGKCQQTKIVTFPNGSKQFQCKVATVDCDGVRFGVQTETFCIEQFDGMQKLYMLAAFPLRIHPDSDDIGRKIVERGRKFRKLQGKHHVRTYNGKAFGILGKYPWEESKTKTTNERVIVDTYGYYDLQGMSPPRLEPLEKLKDSIQKDEDDLYLEHALGYHQDDIEYEKATRGMQRPARKAPGPRKEISPDYPELTEEQLLYLPSTVKGFALASTSWCELEVNSVQDINWLKHTFDQVVLDEQEKRLIRGLLEHQRTESSTHFEDFIPGKGKGTIFLLCGPPGVGKTVTAESISEEIKRPLYKVGMQDLSVYPSSLEASLKEVLARCTRWGAVLLLDEADVFLQRRSVEHLDRNALVSVFLRLLEYYEGTMILTTNRLEVIDPAFESRIDIVLTYDSLDYTSRVKIWRNFLDTLVAHQITEADKQELGKHEMNGRQIKSAMKTACILADNDPTDTTLSIKHLNIVIDVRKKAEKLMTESAVPKS